MSQENKTREMFMEDVGKVASEATDLIIERLKEFGIEVSGQSEDDFFDPIFEEIEKRCSNGYKNHM